MDFMSDYEPLYEAGLVHHADYTQKAAILQDLQNHVLPHVHCDLTCSRMRQPPSPSLLDMIRGTI